MGRLRGGYLGGSTVIYPGRSSGQSGEGPVAALDRARIENERSGAEKSDRKDALKAADERLAVVEDQVYQIAFTKHYGGRDPFADFSCGSLKAPVVHVDFVKSSDGTHLASTELFLALEFEQISALGPSQRRRAKNISDDLKRLKRALLMDGSEATKVLHEIALFRARDRSRILAIDRMHTPQLR